MPGIASLIDAYEQGPLLLANTVGTAPESTWDATPIPGKWSLRQLVCHLADCEIMYADRMKRVLAEDRPLMPDADQEVHVPVLTLPQRTLPTELAVITAVRAHMAPILRATGADSFQRTGNHSLEGPLSLRTLLERVTAHIPHHVRFAEEKLTALQT